MHPEISRRPGANKKKFVQLAGVNMGRGSSKANQMVKNDMINGNGGYDHRYYDRMVEKVHGVNH